MPSPNARSAESPEPTAALQQAAWLRILVPLWLIGAQVAYYLRFRPLLWPVLEPLFRRLWHS